MKIFEKQKENTWADVKQNRFQEKIFAEQINLLYKNLLISVPASFLCATLIFIALFRIEHTHLVEYWYLATIVMSALRLGLSGLYLYDHKATKARFYLFMFTTIIAATLWGFAGYVLMPENHLLEQMITIVIIAGITAGGIQSLQASLLANLSYMGIVIIPLCFWIFSQNDTAHTILGLATTLYLLFTIPLCWRGYHFLNKTLQLKYENIDLTEDVFNTNKQLKETNQFLIEKDNNLRLIHDNAPIGMAIISLDGRWSNVNNRLCEIVGFSKAELEHLTIQDITYKDDLEIDSDSQAKLLSGKLSSYQVEKRYVQKNGQLIWILISVSLVKDKNGKPFYLISQIQDINDRKHNEKMMSELSKMNEMLQLCHVSAEAYPIISHTAQELFIGLSGGIATWNKQTDELETVAHWGDNSLLKPVFKSTDCWAFRSGNVYLVNDPHKELICHHFKSSPSGAYLCLPLIIKNQVIGLLNFNAPAKHVITSYQQQIINNFSEIIKLSMANINLNEVLREQAIHDPLTGLFNRRYLNECLPQMIRTKRTLCVCMIDLDYFKKINDQYGHDAGDEVLKFLGILLTNNFRESDFACRFGGEEFIVILINTDLKQATLRMENIREKIKHERIYAHDLQLPSITLSIGIAEVPQHGETVNDILHAADSALYAAKEAGRDRIVVAHSRRLTYV